MSSEKTQGGTLVDRAEPMVVVDHVSMTFNMASERIGSLKEYAIKIARRELMFKEFKALDDVSFTVNRGDVFGLMGTNGSGKSTMLKIVAGVLEPSSGSCEVNGVIAPLIELGAGFDMELSARENIYLNGALLGYSKQFMEDHFDSIVEFADVEGFLDMPMKNYSSGMVARIAFAIATEVIPDILIVDEVLSVGDFMFQEKCERRIRSLIEDHGVTVLIVSHDSGLIERLCNKAIWIEKGHTKALGEAADVCSMYRLLGGHAGNEEAAERVRSIFGADVDVSTDLVSTMYADSSYGSAVKLAESVSGYKDAKVFVLAPSDSEQICFIANSIAGLLNTSVLLYRSDMLPDSTMGFLKETKPSRVVIVEGPGWSGAELSSVIEDELKCDVEVISGRDYGEVARNAYKFGLRQEIGWSDTFVVTHNNQIADRVSLSPYTYANRIPAFFTLSDGGLAEDDVEMMLQDGCDCLLVVGCAFDIPEEKLSKLDQHVKSSYRFCYSDGYEAAIRISEWIAERDDRFRFREPIVTSAYYPANSFAVGAYAAKTGKVVLMEDPQNLASVVEVYDFLSSKKGEIEKLTFVGDSKTFSKADRTLLAKALVS